MKNISQFELEALLGAVNLRSPFGERDHAMIRLLTNTGLRVAELVGLNVGHVASQGQPRPVLYLPGELAKGGRARSIPLNQGARQAVADLVAFLARRGFSTDSEAPLLVVRQHRRISIRLVQQIVQELRQRSGISTPATPHSCRHFFGTQLVERTSDLCSVSRLLGHARVQSTMRYLHSSPERLAAVVAALDA